jgi:hypothetical protein
MKLAFLLLTCLVGVSYQQRFYVPAPYYGNPAPYYPQFVANPFIQPSLPVNPIIEGREFNEQIEDLPIVEARTPAKYDNAQQRSFFGLFTNITTNFLTTVTSTIYSTTSSTATIGVVSTCIPSTQFVSGSSTVACRRKKRTVDNPMFFDKEEEEAINPDEMSLWMNSMDPVVAKRYAKYEPKIESSQGAEEIDDEEEGINRQNRGLTLVLTTSATITSYSLTTTTLKKTILPGTTTSVLSCLPSGVIVC